MKERPRSGRQNEKLRALLFDHRACLLMAKEILREPPALPRIVRTEGKGTLVAAWALPLELCPPLNRFAEMKPHDRTKIKNSAYVLMLRQTGYPQQKPLSGVPLVRCIRFSSKEPDKDSGWSKVPVDRLLCPKTMRHVGGKVMIVPGLGYLRDDRPSSCQLAVWWEPTKQGAGFVYLDIWQQDA